MLGAYSLESSKYNWMYKVGKLCRHKFLTHQ